MGGRTATLIHPGRRALAAAAGAVALALGLASSAAVVAPGTHRRPGSATAGRALAGSAPAARRPGATATGGGAGRRGGGSGPRTISVVGGTGTEAASGAGRSGSAGGAGVGEGRGGAAGGGSPSGSGGGAGSGPGGAAGGGAGSGDDNLLSPAQADFDGGTATWSGVDATLSWVSSPASGAGGALELVSSGPQAMWAWSGSPQSGGLTPASPGAVYGGAGAVRAGAASLVVQPVIGFYGAGGRYLTSVWGQGTTADPGAWSTVVPADAVAPAGTTGVVLAFLVYTTAPGQELYLQSPVLTGAPGDPAPAVVGPLHTSGDQIVQADGRPVVLRGAELYGLDSSSSPTTVSASAVAAAHAWGANMMRVALGEQLWNATSCAYDPNYVAAVDRAVDWITSAGMVAVLELQDSIVDPGCPAGAPQDMADVAGSVPFWSSVAARYAANPLVVFDLYNEPHDISDALWLDGGLVTDAAGTTYLAAGMQELYDTVRSAGAGNVVLVSGNSWANTVPANLVQGTDIAYSVHAYTCPDAAPPDCADSTPMDPSTILDQWVGLGASYPVVVGEFGWPGTDDGTYIAAVIAFATAHGWSWNAFAWDETAPFGLVSSAPASGPYEPTPSGMPVLAALAGLPPPG